MDISEVEGALHVVHNGSVAGTLRQTLRLRRSDLLESEDPLDCGPMRMTDDRDEWRTAREAFLRSMYAMWPDFSFDEYADNGLFMNARRLAEAERVVVWVGAGLREQLLLAWVVYLFDVVGADVSKLRLVQFQKAGFKYEVRGIGELSPENIRDRYPGARSFNPVEVDELRRAWSVYTSSDPSDLATYISRTSSLSVVHRAIRNLIYRYPDKRSGLGIWDEHLLRYTVEQGPKSLRVIGHTMGYVESLDSPGDFYLFQRLVRLNRLKTPLVSLIGDPSDMRTCKVRITAFGERVLAGEGNCIDENGIDDWIGGVHLNDREPVTFRDGNSLLLN